jgi:HPt (histidine-containing phosphotransfer) domain-containing protein
MSDEILVQIDPDLADLIPGFLANRKRDVQSLTEALGSGDYQAIRILGHSMKGAGGGYGFDPITELGGELEEAALVRDAGKIRALTAQLAAYLARVKPVYS